MHQVQNTHQNKWLFEGKADTHNEVMVSEQQEKLLTPQKRIMSRWTHYIAFSLAIYD